MRQSELPSAWARLHPMSPVARGGKAIAALAAVSLPRQLSQGSEGHLERLLIDGAAAGIVVLGGIVSWLVTRWRVHDGELQLETGLLRRQSIRVPLTRVQAIDVVRPFLARLLGISELRLILAGSGSGKAKLAYLPEARALEVRQLLLGLGHAPEPAAEPTYVQPLASVPNGRLVASALLAGPAITVAVFTVVLVVVALIAPKSIPVLLAGIGPLFVSGTAVIRRINVEFSFSVGESPDGLSLHSGLLQTRAETIRPGRVQCVRLVEPWLWRPLGWCRLEVDVAQQREQEVGQEDVQKLTKALLPVGTRAQAEQLLARVLPGSTSTAPAGSAAPRRARRKAPLSYGRLATWHDERYIAARTGRVQTHTMVVPRDKIQSVRWTQGPLQRRLRLATVHIDTAGRHWKATARDRDEDEGRQLVWQLTSDSDLAPAAALF